MRLHAFTRHPWNDSSKDIKKLGDTGEEERDDKPTFSSKKEDHDKQFSQHWMSETASRLPISKALERIAANGTPEEGSDRISFLDFEAFKAPGLRKDYELPALHQFLPFELVYLSIWPQFEHRPLMLEGESWHCVLDGTEKIRLMSPVFSQNMYQNVYEDLSPMDVPAALDLFKIDEVEFPLLEEVKEYILEARLEKGDCVFIPSMYWSQYETQGDQSIILAFEYQPSSKFTDLLFKAIQEGLHKE